MNVSSVGFSGYSCSPNFKGIKKSAVQQAITESNGSLDYLSHVQKLIEDQKKNEHYDIAALNDGSHTYHVISHLLRNVEGEASSLDEACEIATKLERQREAISEYGKQTRNLLNMADDD